MNSSFSLIPCGIKSRAATAELLHFVLARMKPLKKLHFRFLWNSNCPLNYVYVRLIHGRTAHVNSMPIRNFVSFLLSDFLSLSFFLFSFFFSFEQRILFRSTSPICISLRGQFSLKFARINKCSRKSSTIK